VARREPTPSPRPGPLLKINWHRWRYRRAARRRRESLGGGGRAAAADVFGRLRGCLEGAAPT